MLKNRPLLSRDVAYQKLTPPTSNHLVKGRPCHSKCTQKRKESDQRAGCWLLLVATTKVYRKLHPCWLPPLFGWCTTEEGINPTRRLKLWFKESSAIVQWLEGKFSSFDQCQFRMMPALEIGIVYFVF
mmetsp:Transcript_10071/g.22503  ORF Transcript_10071/g.22503 Transcript_10071/m.22503 type:complete len:128 (-) Transcript_10071:154-537(-)